MNATSNASYALFLIDLQHSYVDKIVKKFPQQEPVFAALTQRCLSVEQELQGHVPTAHILTYRDVRRYCGFSGYKAYYDLVDFHVYQNNVQQLPHPTRSTLAHLDPVYDLTDQNVILKYDHHAFGCASHGRMDAFLKEYNVSNSILTGAFADNCIWAQAEMSAATGQQTTVLLDCIAASHGQVPDDTQQLIAQNLELFKPLQARFPDRLHLTTSRDFLQSVLN